jgi:hypothetical protein
MNSCVAQLTLSLGSGHTVLQIAQNCYTAGWIELRIGVGVIVYFAGVRQPK